VLASHYDTKYFAKGEFVGANDGASSTGLLLELARVLAVTGPLPETWFVFLDGEEAFIEWSSFDSTYGSRHLARRWKEDGTATRVTAFLLLDMIGDRDLGLWDETHSTAWLRELVRTTAREIGLGGILSTSSGAIEDDHLPFLDAGIPAVDLIDLSYGPGNSYHHQLADTLDKVSAESMEKVGRLVLAVLPKLEARGKH
jgi:Zn-dependent M28 family amino/carboxypeptidase